MLELVNTSSTLALYICIVESSMPIAIILLSWGWKARNVAAGGGGIHVAIVCTEKAYNIHKILYKYYITGSAPNITLVI